MHCLKNIITFWILGMLLQNCSETRKESIANPTEKHWYEGGTLHKQKIRDWKNSTEENKLATCADGKWLGILTGCKYKLLK